MTEELKENSKKFLQSYIYSVYGDFMVSTCYRNSNISGYPDIWHYETLAWIIEDKKRTKLIADNSGATYPENAIEQHNKVIKQLFATGKFDEDLKE